MQLFKIIYFFFKPGVCVRKCNVFWRSGWEITQTEYKTWFNCFEYFYFGSTSWWLQIFSEQPQQCICCAAKEILHLANHCQVELMGKPKEKGKQMGIGICQFWKCKNSTQERRQQFEVKAFFRSTDEIHSPAGVKKATHTTWENVCVGMGSSQLKLVPFGTENEWGGDI